MYVCTYVCMYVHMCVCVCLCECMYDMYVCMYVCVDSLHIFVCTQLSIDPPLYLLVYLSLCRSCFTEVDPTLIIDAVFWLSS